MQLPLAARICAGLRPVRPVLFIDGEMTAAQLQERLKAIIEGDGRVIDVPGITSVGYTDLLDDTAPPDLADAADRAELQRIIDEQQRR
jgi:hypothetical protein